MKKAILLPVLVLLVGMTGCGGGNKPLADDFITVDVNADYPEKELILQDFMDVEYIPLETTDEFITQGVVQDVGKNFLVVKNWRSGDIFIFDRTTGKGLRKINRLGQSGEEYSQLSAIVSDEDNQEMFVVDYPARNILVYDLEGNFKRSFKFADTSYYNDLFNYDSDHLIGYKSYLPSVETEQAGHILISKKDGSIVREIPIPFKEIETPVFIKGELSVTPPFYLTMPWQDHWVLMRPSSDTIYRYLPPAGLRPFIVRTPSIHTMEPAVFLFATPLHTDRYEFMQTMKKEVDLTTMKGFPTTDLVYDTEEKALYQCTVYNGDFSNPEEIALGSKAVSPEIAVSEVLNAPDLVEAYEKGKLKGRLKEIAATLNEESNPVIMLIKYKK